MEDNIYGVFGRFRDVIMLFLYSIVYYYDVMIENQNTRRKVHLEENRFCRNPETEQVIARTRIRTQSLRGEKRRECRAGRVTTEKPRRFQSQ